MTRATEPWTPHRLSAIADHIAITDLATPAVPPPAPTPRSLTQGQRETPTAQHRRFRSTVTLLSGMTGPHSSRTGERDTKVVGMRLRLGKLNDWSTLSTHGERVGHFLLFFNPVEIDCPLRP